MTTPATPAPTTSQLPAMPGRTSFVEGVLTEAMSFEGLILLGPACMTLALVRGITHWTGLGGLVTAGIVLGVAAVVLLVSVRRGRGSGAYRVVHGHTNSRKAAAVHEAAHAVVARHIGAGDIACIARNNGAGWTSYRPPEYLTPVEEIAIALAGGMGEGVAFHSAPCRGDKAHADRVLRHVGWFAQGSTMRKAEQVAAAGLRRYSGDVRSLSRKLERRTRVRYR